MLLIFPLSQQLRLKGLHLVLQFVDIVAILFDCVLILLHLHLVDLLLL